jgi:sporulation protein YlmC with PRC-barrel domain
VDLVRDLLDKQVIDRNSRELGRVDSVIIELREDGSAAVAAIEIGFIAVAERVHPFLGRCARAIETVLGVEEGRPVRIPFSKIIDVGKDIKVDIAAGDTPVAVLESKARRWVSTIPGA